MIFSRFSSKTAIGKLLRFPLRLIPSKAILPILRGRIKGMRWIVGSGVHGYWLGIYEIQMQEAIIGRVARGNVFFDVGAHVGYYSLIAATLVGPDGMVFSFEPFSRNAIYLNRHLELNKIENVEVVEAAVGVKSGITSFEAGMLHSMGRVSPDGTIQIPTVSLDELVLEGKARTPDVLKIDVEGAEFDVLQGARRIIKETNPTIFLATHGNRVKTKCLDFLVNLGYEFHPIDTAVAREAREFLVVPSP